MTSPDERPELEALGRAFAQPARLRILQELLAGPPMPAGALAARIGLAASTVSSHLARLDAAGLIRVEQEGRTRYVRLADEEVAEAIESLLRLTGEESVTSLSGDGRRTALRTARSCYDHLAGHVGVALADAGIRDGWIIAKDGTWSLTDPTGGSVAEALGLTLHLPDTSRPLIRTCADWTERRPHIAGRLGQAILDAMLVEQWVHRRRGDRALSITRRGREGLVALGIEPG